MSNQHLARLFERFRSHGNTAALARVFDETAPALFAVARRIARERADAEDAVQATYLVAIERAATWDAERPLEPWLFGILVRQLGLARRKAARVVDPQRLDAERLEDPTLDVERSELVATVAEAVQQLPEHDRAVLEPWHFDELRGTELARRAGVAGSTLRMRLRRGLARLRRALPAGLGATAVVLSAVDRSALAQAKVNVLAAAAKSGGASAAAAAAAATASGAATSFAVKAAAAALLAAAVLGGGALLRARQGAPESTARSAASPRNAEDGKPASDAKTAVALTPRRQSDERGAARESSGPIATSTTTVGIDPGTNEELSADALSGVVVDSSGVPVGEARVLVFDDDALRGGAMAETVTAADGTFHFAHLDAGGVHVVAEKRSLGRASSQSAPMRTNVKLEFGRGARFEGRVVNDDGTAAALATVELADDEARFLGTKRATADADGHYLFEAVHGRVRFVRAELAEPRRIGFTVLDPDDDHSSASSEVVVRAPRHVELTVAARGDGRPIENALVLVRAGGEALGAAGLDVRGAGLLEALEPFVVTATSDAAGRVALAEVPACDTCSIAVVAPGFAPTARSFATTGDVTLNERLELEAACTVEGVARRADGTPLADATVAVEQSSPLRELRARPDSLDSLRSIVLGAARPFALETRTRADGTFTLEGLPPLVACNLRVESQRRAAYAWIDALHPGEVRRDVVVTFDAKVRIEGTLVAEDGVAPETTKLWLQPASELAKFDRDGRFSFEFTPHGAATIWAIAPGYVYERCDVAAPLPGVSKVAITLHRGRSLAGSVVDARGRPVAGTRLIVWPAEPTFEERRKTGGWISEVNLACGWSRDDGSFEIRGLPERALRLVVWANGYEGEELTPVAPDRRDLAITLRSAR